jgi:hypothetical protein
MVKRSQRSSRTISPIPRLQRQSSRNSPTEARRRQCVGSSILIFLSKANKTIPHLKRGLRRPTKSPQPISSGERSLLGVNAVADASPRQRGTQFYADSIANLPPFASERGDHAKAASLAAEARRLAKGNPGLIDGLIAAIALRTGAKVATRNTVDFKAMGCPVKTHCKNLQLLSNRDMTQVPATETPDLLLDSIRSHPKSESAPQRVLLPRA